MPSPDRAALRAAPIGTSAETVGSPTLGGFQDPQRTVRPFGEAKTAASSNWALVPAPILATGSIGAAVVPT
eukprot:15179241-Alexandrium_andersonii.AAC.1